MLHLTNDSLVVIKIIYADALLKFTFVLNFAWDWFKDRLDFFLKIFFFFNDVLIRVKACFLFTNIL